MKFALTAIAAVAIVVASVAYFEHKKGTTAMPDEVVTAWTSWKQTNGRAYGADSEEKYRMQVFYENFQFVQNFKDDMMTVALNGFADLTNAEFKKQFTGYKNQPSAQKNVRTLSTADVPDSMDWREHNAVTEVKNQGSCGSCWAFSTTGSMESRYFLANGTLPRLSEQQFVDCAKAQGNEGCNGGMPDWAFEYAKTTGIETESQYAYTGRDGKCSANKDGVKVVSYADVKKNSPSQLKAAVAQGPVSIGLDGAGLAFQLYFGGIVRFACGTSLDHGVLIAGYGSSNSMIFGKTDYWIVKNSWGGSWGEKGYLRIKNNNKEGEMGICGINQAASYPIF